MTETILQSVLERLQAVHGEQLEIRYYPQDADHYRLNHPVGAVLLGYSRSQFSTERGLDATWVTRDLSLPLTLVFCQLDGADGVIAWLDRLRETLTGFTPAHCDMPMRPVSELFLGEETGIWQYGQEWATRTVQVQVVPDAVGLPLVAVDFKEDQS